MAESSPQQVGADKKLASGPSHPNVYGACSAVHGGKLYLYGGNYTFDRWPSDGTVHVFDFVEFKWTSVQTKGECPHFPSGGSAVVVGDSFYVFGGFVGGRTATMHALSLVEYEWKLLTSDDSSVKGPSWKDKAGMVDYDNQWFCVMGGYCQSEPAIARQRGASYHFDSSGTFCWTNELHTFHIQSCEWLYSCI